MRHVILALAGLSAPTACDVAEPPFRASAVAVEAAPAPMAVAPSQGVRKRRKAPAPVAPGDGAGLAGVGSRADRGPATDAAANTAEPVRAPYYWRP